MKKEQVCWPGEPEIQTTKLGKRRPARLPPELADAAVRRPVMLLELCVSDTGEVARVLVLESSDIADVDNYHTTETSKWIFTPVERGKKRVQSVVPVTVTLYVK